MTSSEKSKWQLRLDDLALAARFAAANNDAECRAAVEFRAACRCRFLLRLLKTPSVTLPTVRPYAGLCRRKDSAIRDRDSG